MTSFLPSLAALILVLAAIPAVLWLIKRMQVVRPARSGSLAVVAGIAVGPRERIAIVESGDRWLVVGVTAHNITLLDTRERPSDAVAPEATATESLTTDALTTDAHARARERAPLQTTFAALLRQRRGHA